MEDLRKNLGMIRLALETNFLDIDKICEEIVKEVSSLGLSPQQRAEGYAFVPSIEAMILGLPQLRLGKINGLLTAWIRAPHALDEGKCRMVGLNAEEVYTRLISGATKIAEIFMKYCSDKEALMISLPSKAL